MSIDSILPVDPRVSRVTGRTHTGSIATGDWLDVCRHADLEPERGACALVRGLQIALFRTHGGNVHALSNYDPFSGAYVLSRGIVGSRGEAPTVASPMYKQVFDLRTGRCLDDPDVAVPAYPVRVRNGRVEVALP